MLKVVLDTNVIVSAILSRSGTPAHVLQAWRHGRFLLLTSPAIVREVTRVLARPYFHTKRGFTEAEIEGIGRLLERDALVIEPLLTLQAVHDDPDDDRILECAVAGKADYLVSGDTHLLSLKKYGDVPIVTAAAFLAILNAKGQGA